MKETVLIVEDDLAIAKGIETNLRYEGYDVFSARDGERGLELAVDRAPDLIVLDVMMPRMNGFEVLRELRRRDIQIPVIMLTAKSEEMDKVRGLDLGADDYITKPFGLQELLARIQAVLRRKRRFDQKIERVSFGRVELDFKAKIARVDGQEVEMTAREFALIQFFLSRQGEALSRQEILNRVWGFDYFGTDRTVDNFINRLRHKFEPDPDHPVHFLTVRGVGYRFELEPGVGDEDEQVP